MAQSTSRRGTVCSETVEICIDFDDDVGSYGSASDVSRPDLRLVVLGGDCAYNNCALDCIFRTNTNLAVSPKKGSFRDGTVDGRQVSVFVAPSYWMNHLASYWIFSNGVESIRGEIQNCTSVTFPGPHAFLLVMRAGHTTGKEHLLLKAITYMFGAEALHYTMVVFVYGHEWENPRDVLKNRCVKMCERKYFKLENSDENVEELFRKIDAMTQREKSRIFVQHAYEKLIKVSYNSWESSCLHKESKLKQKLAELKTERDTLRQTESDLRKELEASRHRESVLQMALNTARDSERRLKKELEEFQGSEAGHLEPVRRNSNELGKPNMSENQNEPREQVYMT